MASPPVSPEHVPPGFLGLQEAADRLGVHYMTAYRYVRTGRLPATRIGSQWWVDPEISWRWPGSGVAGRPGGDAEGVTGGRGAAARGSARRRGRARAWTIVESRLGSGSDPDEILMDELGQAMRSVGAGWEAGTYTVDDEHRASGVASRLVARLGARFTTRGPKRGSVVLGTPPTSCTA